MKMRKLAIVGRPNVGKSALFNRICKRRISIVDEQEGVTRDRIYAQAEIFGYPFEVIDAGGIDPHSDDPFKKQITMQAEEAIREADTLIMVVDARCGVLDLDREVARILLKSQKPLALAVNKIDNEEQEMLLHQFHSLGIEPLFSISAAHGRGVADLLEAAWAPFSSEELKEEDEEEAAIKVCIAGRANAGKSTLLNALLDEKRCVVSQEAGTTRDALDIPFSVNGREYVLIDTAGVRRKKAEKESVDKFAAIRTEEAIRRADICLLVLDAREGMSTQEKRIARQIEKEGKGCILLLNKWDLVKGFRMEACLKAIRQESPFLAHAPVLFISAKTGRNLDLILPEVQKVYRALTQKLSTHQLNTFVEKAIQLNHPPMLQGKRLRIYYLTQVAHSPPRFMLFINNTSLMTPTYKKYLINQFRLHYNFLGTPLRLTLKGKKREGRSARSG